MTTEVLPAAESNSDASVPALPQPRPDHPRGNLPTARKGKWRTRGLLGIGLVAVLGSAGAILPSALSPDEKEAALTHTITRSDLVVTVTEQGTLESSDNHEIACKVRGNSTVTYVVPSGTVVKQGDELVKLDTKVIEEALSLTKTNVFIAEATLAETTADAKAAKIAINAYLKGRYVSRKKSLERELTIAEANLLAIQKLLKQSELLFKRGFVTELELQGNQLSVTQATLERNVRQRELDVLEEYTKKMELTSLNGALTYNTIKLEADIAGLEMEKKRKARAEQELKNCAITADRDGLVIYPSAAAWKNTPDITEGVSVRKDQVLLLMPDLAKMQVKIGVHESIIERVKLGMTAIVTLPGKTLEAQVTSVATIARQSGWWNGNAVNYDVIIELPSDEGLKPGMSAVVEVVVARHNNVVTVPVSSVVETENGDLCWVQTVEGLEKRPLQLGDSNDVFIVVESGLKEGDEVVLNPAGVEETEQDASQEASEEAVSNSPTGDIDGD